MLFLLLGTIEGQFRSRLNLATLGLWLLVLIAARPAFGWEPSIRIGPINVSTRPAIADIVVSLPPYASSGLSGLPQSKVYVDGQELRQIHEPGREPGFALQWHTDTEQQKRLVIVMVDVSSSVRPAFDKIKRLGEKLVTNLPQNSDVLLMSFGRTARVVVPATNDRRAFASALSSLVPNERATVLYDALLEGLRIFQEAPVREATVILLTDGADDGSVASPEDVINQIRLQPVKVSGFDATGASATGARFLRRLAITSRGKYSTIDHALNSSSNSLLEVTEPATLDATLAFWAPQLETSGFHEVTFELLNADQGRQSAAHRSFYSEVRPQQTFDYSFLLTLLVLLLVLSLAVLSAFAVLWRRKPLPPASSGAADLQTSSAPPPTQTPPIGELRQRVLSLREELASLDKHILDYGHPLELKASRWRNACHETVRNSVETLKSCWLIRMESADADLTYKELLSRLASLGLREILPRVGDQVNPSDRHYLIRGNKGVPPYHVSKILFPGYRFAPNMPWKEDESDQLLVAAEIEVESLGGKASGKHSDQATRA